MISNPAVANAVAFFLIAAGVMIAATVAGRLVHSTAHAVGLGFFNRLGGAAFGLVRGCLIGIAILMGISAFLPGTDLVKNSHLAPYFLEGSHALFFVVPDHFQKQVADGATHMLQQAPTYMKPRTLEWKHSE